MGEKREVGRREVEGGEFGGREPAERDMLVRMRRGAADPEAAEEGQHPDHDGGVVVFVGGKRADELNVAAELFTDFADEGRRGFFVGLDLAAGELPLEAEVFVRRALRDKNAPGVVRQQRADDGNRRER